MATEVISTIRASGGDYTTLSAWEAGEQRNLVTADEIAVAVCYNDWPTGLVDELDINGWTTDATRYVKVTVAEGHRHNGTPKSGFHMKKTSTATTLVFVRHSYTVLEWIDAEQLGTSGKFGIRHLTATSPTFRYCISKNATAENGAFSFSVNGATLIQCFAYDTPYGFGNSLTTPSGFYGCVAANCSNHGFYVGGGSVVAKNCIAYNCGTGYRTVGFSDANSSNNATSAVLGTYLPGADGVSGVTAADFANAAANDFHLSSGSVLRGAGANLYSDFTTDIDGDTWPSSGAWDIGFDYYVAAGGGVTVEPVAGRASARGYAPTLAQPITITPTVGRASSRGYAPTIEQSAAQTIATLSGRAEARGYAPSISQPITLTPAAGHAIARGYAPEISQASSIRPDTGRALASGYAPTIGQPRTIAAQTGRAQASGHSPIIVHGVPIVIDPQTGRVSARGYAPGVVQGGAVTVSPVAGMAAARGWSPSVTTMPIGGYPSSVTITVPVGRLMSAAGGRTITLRPR